jgi:hypothetical protein
MPSEARIRTVVMNPDHICEWWVGEIWVTFGGRSWREDTIVDIDEKNLNRRVTEEVERLRQLFDNGSHEIMFS